MESSMENKSTTNSSEDMSVSDLDFLSLDMGSAEIENLKSKIDELKDFLLYFNSDQRKEEQEEELLEIQKQIDKARKNYENSIEKQKAQQEKEIQLIIKTQQKEISEIESTISGFNNESDNWIKLSHEIQQITDQIELNNLTSSLEKAKAEDHETEFLKSINLTSSQITQDPFQEFRVQSIQSEVDQYTILLNQEQEQFKSFESKCLDSIKSLNEGKSSLFNHLKSEEEKRDALSSNHLRILDAQISKENERFEFTILSLKNKENSLNMLKSQIVKKYNQKLQEATTNIEKMEEMLKKLQESEQQDKTFYTSSFAKMNSYRKQNNLLQQKIKKIEEEQQVLDQWIYLAKSELERN